MIDQDRIVPQEYTTYFRSVIAFGTVRVLEEETEKRAAIQALAAKYAPRENPASQQAAIDREWAALCMLELSISHMTGKQAIELTKDN